MSLQRYDMIVSQSGNHMQKKEDGDWVDAEEAQAEIDRLTEKVKNLEAVMTKRQNDAAAYLRTCSDSYQVHPRASNVKCPRCGECLSRPWHEGDYRDWDCHHCGLCIPESVRIDGADVIECLRVLEWREMVSKLIPGIEA